MKKRMKYDGTNNYKDFAPAFLTACSIILQTLPIVQDFLPIFSTLSLRQFRADKD